MVDPRTGRPSLRPRRTAQQVRRERLVELAASLQACRIRISPATAGVPATARRRTLGLRREEVAARAGVSTDWYVRIEQGRDVNPSAHVLNALASALLMSEAERSHLHVLARRTGRDHPATAEPDLAVLRRLIDGLSVAPAYVLDRRWDVLAQNDAAVAFFGDWSTSPDPRNNLLYRFFTDPVFTECLEEWDKHARLAIRQYRTVFARGLADPRLPALVATVADASPDFSRWWSEADVAGRDDGRKVFHPRAGGNAVFDYVVLRPSANDGAEVVAFLPAPDRK
jgi:transcriptional regulator with XRE-family HTH domain